MTDADADTRKPPRFYGRRHGRRLRPGRRERLEATLPALRLPLPPEGRRLDPRRCFEPAITAFRLEIGFGGGEHLAAQAATHPHVGFIGCEPYLNGVASLLTEIERRQLANVRVFDDDVRRLLPALPDRCVERIDLPFPDPWPKARHWNRRLINAGTLDAFARILVDGGELRTASDHMGYARWTLEHVLRHPAFAWTAQRPADWRHRPVDESPTRYEEKALARGDRCVYLRVTRVGRDRI